MKYLGMPLGGNPIKFAFWDPVVSKIHKRLEGWKRGSLSRGGRLALIRSVLTATPTYFLSLFKIPKKVALEIERKMQEFF